MVRTVKVRLELDRDDYKRGLRDAANETRGFDGEVRTAGKDVDAMGVEVKAMGRDVQAAGREVDTAAKGTARLGGEAKTTRQNVVDLAKEIDKTKTSLKSMGEEFQRTGKVNVDELKKLSNALRDLERAKATIDKLVPGGDKGFVSHIISAVDGGLQAAGKLAASHPYIAAGIAAGIALGAPVIGGALAAAVGAGGIAAGILLAAQDQRVGHAWSVLGDSARDKLTGAADVFVEPLIRGSRVFGDTLDRIMPSIRDDFEFLAPLVDRLFTGTGRAVENLMPGIDALVKASGPALTMLADELPRTTAAFSTMFKEIADGGPGGVQALHDLLTLVNALTIATGATIGTTEKLYTVTRASWAVLAATFTNNQTAWDNAVMSVAELQYGTEAVTPVADKAVGAYKRFAAAVGATGQGAQITAEQLKTLSGQINTTTVTADTLAGQMAGKLFNSMMSIDQAALGFAESQTRLSESIKDNGLQLDIHTDKGQRNRESILAAVQANMAQYQANITVGMSATDAAAAYDANTAALERQLQKAGLTQTQIDGLIGKYRGVPDNVNTEIATQGLTAAITGLDNLIRRVNGIPTRKDIYITQHLSTTGGFSYKSPDRVDDYPNRWGGLYTHAATGALRDASIYSAVSSGARYAFAEPQTGGEAFIPKSGDLERSRGIWSYVGANWLGMGPMAGSGGGGGGSMSITITAAPGGTMVDQAMSSWFMSAVRQGQITLATDDGSRVRVG